MNESVVLYQCPDCGYIVEVVNPGSPDLICSGEAFAATCVEVAAGLECCGKKMIKLEPNTVEASQEKHLPVVTIEGNIVKVKVGSVEQCWIWGRQSKRRLCDGSNRLGVSGGARSGGSSRCLAAFALAVFCFRCLRICSMTFGSSMLAITLT